LKSLTRKRVVVNFTSVGAIKPVENDDPPQSAALMFP
jgi:hypothetical protein